MYTAPPSGDDSDRRPETSTDDGREEAPEAASETTDERAADEAETPPLEPTTATTDANWTGSVPADD
jgi:hypothetical protein